MTHPKENVRVRRTQKLLREALVALIEERGFEALTVGVLTERALVSRAAFYRNYRDKYDIVEQIFVEAMRSLLDATDEVRSLHPAPTWVHFFEHIAQYGQMYRSLLGRKGSPWFVAKMQASLAEMIEARGPQPSSLPAAVRSAHTFSDTLLPDLVAAMWVEAIAWWLEHGRPYSPKEMATRSALLASALFKEAHAWC